MITSQKIALWADQLRDISAMGLRFSESQYDRDRYGVIQQLALTMLAAATDEPVQTLEPLRAPVISRPTPFSAGDAAVINDQGEILLIQRADNRMWAMPGGALEVGETPAEGVVREVLEETGIHCAPVALIGIFDSRLCRSATRHHLYLFTFLCRPLDGQAPGPASHALEVLGVGWFAQKNLPAQIDPGHITRIPYAYQTWRGEREAFFDR